MIEYVIADNPDDRILEKASSVLKSGGLICLPTDTNWIIVADPFSKKGVSSIYKAKNIDKLKHLSLLCSSISKASEVAIIEDNVFRLLKKKIPGHFTFIFEATKKITRAVQANKMDHEVGIRFVPSKLVEKLLETHGDVLISTNIDLTQFNVEEKEIYSYMIEETIGNQIEMIIDPGDYEFVGKSTIVDFTNGSPEVIRQGVGEI
jgi:tRNA threonylcarbamoyl adenosine modification protein (Sua5/YciO/YrdC/YwlC family)